MDLLSPPAPLSMTQWLSELSRSRLTVLAAHRVPVQLWLGTDADDVLHFRARGTTFTLRRYPRSELVSVVLRSECDCAEHRTAGAAHRVALTPHAVPLAEAAIDGADRYGWTGVEAALAPIAVSAAALGELLPRVAMPQPGADPVGAPSDTDADRLAS